MCSSRGNETIIQSIMVLTSPLGVYMFSASPAKQTDATMSKQTILPVFLLFPKVLVGGSFVFPPDLLPPLF